MEDEKSPIIFDYKFSFEDGTEKNFTITLDPHTLNYIPTTKNNSPPRWTNLNYSRCENCPLNEKTHKYCPIALNIVELFDCFNSLFSYKMVEVFLTTNERSYFKKTTIQQSLGSMLGIYMVTSGCPIMDKLKPMVRFHLPFATVEETVFHSVGVYLLGQYVLLKRGLKADFELTQLRNFYLEIQKVNCGMASRLRAVTERDAFTNAVITLDAFAKELPWCIEDQLKNMEYLFDAYFH